MNPDQLSSLIKHLVLIYLNNQSILQQDCYMTARPVFTLKLSQLDYYATVASIQNLYRTLWCNDDIAKLSCSCKNLTWSV